MRCLILLFPWSWWEYGILGWLRKCCPAFLIIPATLFHSFGFLKVKKVAVFLTDRGNVVRRSWYSQLRCSICFLRWSWKACSILDRQRKRFPVFLQVRHSILLLPWSWGDCTILDWKRKCSAAFLIIPASFFCFLKNKKGCSILDYSSCVVWFFCFLKVEEIVVFLTDRGNVVQRSW